MSPLPPTRRLFPAGSPIVSAAVVAAALITAAVAAGCGTSPGPDVDRLLVAADGRLTVSDGSGALASFDGPPEPVIAVTAAGGRLVAGTAEGALLTSPRSGGGTPAWQKLAAPTALPASGPPLMALSPLGKELALAVGDPQGKQFDLVLLDIGAGTSRTIPVARGLNGPPAWIGPASVAINVLGPTDHAEIATIDIASGGVTDESAAATVITATADGQRVAVDQPSGEVLIGDVEAWRQGALASMARLSARAGSTVESLALSPDGRRLALVRRDDAGAASLELYVAIVEGWTSVRSHSLTGDGPISIAWLR